MAASTHPSTDSQARATPLPMPPTSPAPAGRRLRELRRSVHLGLERFARACGVAPEALARIEAGPGPLLPPGVEEPVAKALLDACVPAEDVLPLLSPATRVKLAQALGAPGLSVRGMARKMGYHSQGGWQHYRDKFKRQSELPLEKACQITAALRDEGAPLAVLRPLVPWEQARRVVAELAQLAQNRDKGLEELNNILSVQAVSGSLSARPGHPVPVLSVGAIAELHRDQSYDGVQPVAMTSDSVPGWGERGLVERFVPRASPGPHEVVVDVPDDRHSSVARVGNEIDVDRRDVELLDGRHYLVVVGGRRPEVVIGRYCGRRHEIVCEPAAGERGERRAGERHKVGPDTRVFGRILRVHQVRTLG